MIVGEHYDFLWKYWYLTILVHFLVFIHFYFFIAMFKGFIEISITKMQTILSFAMVVIFVIISFFLSIITLFSIDVEINFGTITLFYIPSILFYIWVTFQLIYSAIRVRYKVKYRLISISGMELMWEKLCRSNGSDWQNNNKFENWIEASKNPFWDEYIIWDNDKKCWFEFKDRREILF
jgi:hypothetical protein